jgi:hypothetical protein
MNLRAKGCLAAFAAFAAIAAAILASGWWFLDGSTIRPRILRSRMTLVVQTPEGERSGSSVTQLTTYFPGGLTKAQGWGITKQLVGEAVVVDLGQRGLLFATLRNPTDLTFSGGGGLGGGYNAGLAAFPQDFRGDNEQYAAYLDGLNRMKPKSVLSLKDLPVLVRFTNLNDPTSAALVDPHDLAASFGPGVIFKGAIVEITDDPVTKGIETRLPWLKLSKVAEYLFPNPSHQPRPDTLVMLLTYDDFRDLPR